MQSNSTMSAKQTAEKSKVKWGHLLQNIQKFTSHGRKSSADQNHLFHSLYRHQDMYWLCDAPSVL